MDVPRQFHQQTPTVVTYCCHQITSRQTEATNTCTCPHWWADSRYHRHSPSRFHILNHIPPCLQQPARGWTGALRSGQGRLDVRRMDDRNLKNMSIDHAIYATTWGFALTQETPIYHIYHILHVTTCHLSRWSAKSSNCNLWRGAKLIEFFGQHFLQN